MDEPKRIGEFEIKEELLHGSLTTIYTAHHPVLNRTVLIKKLHQKLLSETDIKDRFIREAQVCAQLTHPNIVEIYDFKVSDEATYLVLEYVKGKNLTELMGGEFFPVEVALSILIQILHGIGHAHSNGIVHRDIKPDNILISDHGQVKISDFGLAFIEGSHSLTRQGMVIGTPSYMSPEQAAGKKIDFRSDIFSVGTTAFEMLTGINVYKSETLTECLRKIISNPAPKLSDFRVDVPIRLERMISGMMEKNPEKRWTNTVELINEIENLSTENEILLGSSVIARFSKSRHDYVPSGTIKPSTTTNRIKLRTRIRAIFFSLFMIFIAIVIGVVLFIPFEKPTRFKEPVSIPEDSTAVALGDTVFSIVQDTSAHKGISPSEKESDDSKTSKPGEIADQKIDTSSIQTGKKPEKVGAGSKAELSDTAFITDTVSVESLNIATIDSTPGELTFNADPYVYVYIDDVFKGSTPLLDPIEISPGEHIIYYVRTDLGISISKTIEISPGERKHEVEDFWSYLGRIWIMGVDPWAYLVVDGEVIDTIPPFENPLILPLGPHKIELKNPDFNSWVWEHEFTHGMDPETLKVSLVPKE